MTPSLPLGADGEFLFRVHIYPTLDWPAFIRQGISPGLREVLLSLSVS